jgi:cytochrome b6-f complex iron-sulfur subunit
VQGQQGFATLYGSSWQKKKKMTIEVMGSSGGEGNFAGRHVSRRRILNWFLGTSVGALLISILYPVTRYLIPPRAEESSARTVSLSVKPDDVKANSGQIFKFGSQPGILIRTPDGDLRAFTAICTHLACIVQYRPDLGHIWCACHNGHFDLNGKNIAGPPPRPLEPYVANVRGNQVVVSKAS